MKEYKAVNLKSPMMIFWLIISLAISVVMFWFFTISTVLWLSIFAFIWSLFFPFIIFYSLTSKVILSSDSIVKKTIFGKKELKYSDIKSFGVYIQMRYSGLIVNEKDIQKTNFDQKFVYLSNRTNYNPNSFNQKGSIRFHMIDDIYESLKGKITKPAANSQ